MFPYQVFNKLFKAECSNPFWKVFSLILNDLQGVLSGFLQKIVVSVISAISVMSSFNGCVKKIAKSDSSFPIEQE